MTTLARFSVGGQEFALRRAVRADVAAIVGLLAADQLGAARDGGELAPYERAFDTIDADPAQLLVVLTPVGVRSSAPCS